MSRQPVIEGCVSGQCLFHCGGDVCAGGPVMIEQPLGRDAHVMALTRRDRNRGHSLAESVRVAWHNWGRATLAARESTAKAGEPACLYIRTGGKIPCAMNCGLATCKGHLGTTGAWPFPTKEGTISLKGEGIGDPQSRCLIRRTSARECKTCCGMRSCYGYVPTAGAGKAESACLTERQGGIACLSPCGYQSCEGYTTGSSGEVSQEAAVIEFDGRLAGRCSNGSCVGTAWPEETATNGKFWKCGKCGHCDKVAPQPLKNQREARRIRPKCGGCKKEGLEYKHDDDVSGPHWQCVLCGHRENTDGTPIARGQAKKQRLAGDKCCRPSCCGKMWTDYSKKDGNEDDHWACDVCNQRLKKTAAEMAPTVATSNNEDQVAERTIDMSKDTQTNTGTAVVTASTVEVENPAATALGEQLIAMLKAATGSVRPDVAMLLCAMLFGDPVNSEEAKEKRKRMVKALRAVEPNLSDSYAHYIGDKEGHVDTAELAPLKPGVNATAKELEEHSDKRKKWNFRRMCKVAQIVIEFYEGKRT